MYQTYQVTVLNALGDLYAKTISFLPNLIAAVIVLIVLWIVGIFLSRLVRQALDIIKVDHFANQLGLNNLSQKTGRKLSLAALGAWVVKWFFFLWSIIAAAVILGLTDVYTFLFQQVLSYAGHVVGAMVILLLGILAAKFFSEVVIAAVNASGLHKGNVLGAITSWAIIIFAIIAALAQLQIATSFLQDFFRAIVTMLAIAGGLAFGLGGKEHAKKTLDAIEESLKE